MCLSSLFRSLSTVQQSNQLLEISIKENEEPVSSKFTVTLTPAPSHHPRNYPIFTLPSSFSQMAEEFVGLALDSVPTIVNKYDTIADRSKRTIKKLPIPGRKSNRGEQEYYQEGVDDYGPPRRSQTEKQRPRDSYYADDQDKKYSYNQR